MTINFVVENEDAEFKDVTVNGTLTTSSTVDAETSITDRLEIQDDNQNIQFVIDGDDATPAFDLKQNLMDNVQNIRTQGAGSAVIDFQDAANSNNSILTLNEGGNVEIPNGNLELTGGNITSPVGDSGNLRPTVDSSSGSFGDRNWDVRVSDNNGDNAIFEYNGGGNEWNFRNNSTGNNLLTINQSGEVDIPNGNLDQSGSNGSFVHDRQDVSANLTTDGSGYYSVDTSGGAVTVTLATSDATDGKEINVKRNGANSVTIDTEGTQTIDGSSSTTLGSDDDAVTLVFNSTNSDWETY